MSISGDFNNLAQLVSQETIHTLTELRHTLHQVAELSGEERITAKCVHDFLAGFHPDELLTEIGGFGVAAVYHGHSRDGGILLRADLDALPIPETLELEYGSVLPDISHKCGHDGHMAMLAGVASWLSKQTDRKTDVILLFQPSEETGQGASRVLHDPKFSRISPSLVFALHNLPGFPLGEIITSDAAFASASRGLVIDLLGQTSHAAEPHLGNSPAGAVASLIQELNAVTQNHTALNEAAKVTVVHAKLGELAFGTSPGKARVAATLRSHRQDTMEKLSEYCEKTAVMISKVYGLKCKISWEQPFPVTENNFDSTRIIIDAANAIGVSNHRLEEPFPWSEDFGHFTNMFKGAMFGLGAGENFPALHNPEYDFPDPLIPVGTSIFISILKQAWSLESSV